MNPKFSVHMDLVPSVCIHTCSFCKLLELFLLQQLQGLFLALDLYLCLRTFMQNPEPPPPPSSSPADYLLFATPSGSPSSLYTSPKHGKSSNSFADALLEYYKFPQIRGHKFQQKGLICDKT